MNQYEAFKDTVALAEKAGMPVLPGTNLGLDHMRDTLSRITPASPPSTLGRWLGWAQCALVAAGVGVTFDDVEAINTRWGEPDKAQRSFEKTRIELAKTLSAADENTASGTIGRVTGLPPRPAEFTTPREAPPSPSVRDSDRDLLEEITRSLKAMVDAFGGNVPDWLAEEYAAAENAIERVERARRADASELEP